jgi:hypothetical protein
MVGPASTTTKTEKFVAPVNGIMLQFRPVCFRR